MKVIHCIHEISKFITLNHVNVKKITCRQSDNFQQRFRYVTYSRNLPITSQENLTTNVLNVIHTYHTILMFR